MTTQEQLQEELCGKTTKELIEIMVDADLENEALSDAMYRNGCKIKAVHSILKFRYQQGVDL